nr:MAG TPA: hypothetical protein [Myoviridae sp. ct6nn14]
MRIIRFPRIREGDPYACLDAKGQNLVFPA